MQKAESKFKELELQELINFFNGKSIKAKDTGEYNVFGANGIIGKSNEFNYQDSIVIGRVGAYCGAVKYAKEKFWASDNTIIVKGKNKDYNDIFIYYLLLNMNLNKYAGGAAQPLLTQTTLKQLKAKVPVLNIQEKIASILSAYDNLIQNNTRRIKILEEMAQNIYKEWFVNYRFPNHEDAEFVEHLEFGRIPKAWSTTKICDIATIYKGKSYKSSELSEDEGLPFLNLKSIERDGGFRRDGLKWFTGTYTENQIVKPKDIIMAVTDMTQERRLVARCARIPSNWHGKYVLSMDLIKISPREKLSIDYLYSMLRFSSFANETKIRANGANVLHLSPKCVEEYVFLLPTEKLIEKFSNIVSDFYNLIDTLELKNENLRKTRDLLLPRLISGEIDVESMGLEKDLTLT